MLLFFLLLPLTTLLILVKGDLQEMQTRNFAVYFLVIPLLLACIPFFTYSRRKIIFEQTTHAVYQQTIFGNKMLLRFDQVADIILKPTLGIAYYLKSKEDRFGKGYRVSPSFANIKDKGKQEYESIVLPAIRQLLLAQAAPAPEHSLPVFDSGSLVFYKPQGTGYVLKPRGTLKFIPALLLFGFGAWSLRSQPLGLLALLPVIFTLAVASRRIVFDTARRQVRVCFFGFPVFTYPLADFAGFAIVRKTYNGLYNGTDVRMKFAKPGNTRKRELMLADFRKTNPIDPFMNETEFVMKG
jgi:hypothetical protein